jgi:hypothetical protein
VALAFYRLTAASRFIIVHRLSGSFALHFPEINKISAKEHREYGSSSFCIKWFWGGRALAKSERKLVIEARLWRPCKRKMISFPLEMNEKSICSGLNFLLECG